MTDLCHSVQGRHSYSMVTLRTHSYLFCLYDAYLVLIIMDGCCNSVSFLHSRKKVGRTRNIRVKPGTSTSILLARTLSDGGWELENFIFFSFHSKGKKAQGNERVLTKVKYIICNGTSHSRCAPHLSKLLLHFSYSL